MCGVCGCNKSCELVVFMCVGGLAFWAVVPAARINGHQAGGWGARVGMCALAGLCPCMLWPPPTRPDPDTPPRLLPRAPACLPPSALPCLQVSFSDKSLVFNVGIGKAAPTSDMKALPGGERSLASLAFILALGTVGVNPPFHALDEFDV